MVCPRLGLRRLSPRYNLLELTTCPISQDDPLKRFATQCGILPEENLLSETHISRISHWLQTCSEQHEHCPRNNEAKELPKRVIEINSNEPQSVKLVHTSPGERAIYACLSYCWGHGGQYCTYKHNIKDHLQHISVSDLPATVADAIRLCRALQIPYLWVDALCIIQDDEVDWSREAAAMARIYGSANLTISTPSTTSCSEGFLVRDVGSRSSLDWIHPHSRTKGVVTMRSWSEPSFDQSPIDEQETPWMQRGWTLQEWVLSPRLLHCGSTMTMFECLHGRCYEIFPDTPEGPFVVFGRQHYNGAPPPKLIDNQIETGRISSDKAVEANGMTRMFKSFEYWNDPNARPVISWVAIVEEFCRRQLTRDTDKLSALAGLAVEFRAYKRIWCPTQQQWDYVAGLWWCGNSMVGLTGHDGELPGALLWRGATHRSNPLSTPPVYRAPSWSWAAVDGPITFNKGVGGNKLEILDVVCHHEYPGSFSSVTTGWIDAHGLMRRVWPVGRTIEDKPKGLRCQPEGKGKVQDDEMWYADFDNAHIEKLKEFEIFLLLVETCNDLPGMHDSRHTALILRRVECKQGCLLDCFIRMGLALVDYDSMDPNRNTLLKDWKLQKLRLF